MSDKIYFLKNVETGEKIGIEKEDLVEHRMQILAGSGGGKSQTARALCENGYGHFQQILISPKIEYVTLREKFDYLHVGKSSEIAKPDIELNTRYAGQLALKLLESHANTVIEFSQAPLERIKYVRNFIESAMSAPMQLWHPVMFLIDEIDIWAPEKGHGEAESLAAIIDLAARGRDKGFFLVGITQHLAKFNKDVAAELDIKIVGKVTLDVHQTRAAQELGIPLKEKNKLRLLGKPNYHFYAYGPGLSDEIIKVQSLPIQTTHESGYKRNKHFKTIPTPEKIKQIVSSFADLPQEAEKELKTKDDMQKHIKELTVRLHQLEKQQPKPVATDPLALQKAEHIGYQKGTNDAKKQFDKFETSLKNYIRTFKPIIQRAANVGKELSKLEEIIPDIDDTLQTKLDLKLPSLPIETKLPPAPTVSTKSVVVTRPVTVGEPLTNNDILSPAETRVLIAIVQRPNHTGSRIQIGVMTEYTPSSGSFRNIIGKLRSSGFIQYSGDDLIATESGISAAGNYEPLPTDHSTILSNWCAKLPGPEKKILTAVCEVYPDTMTREELGEKIGQSSTSGSFRNSIGHLRSTGLIEYIDKSVKASKEMFPE